MLFEQRLTVLKEPGLVRAGGKQRTGSTHVLAAVRALSRLEGVGETMRHALEKLTVAAPMGLRHQAGPDWLKRDGQPMDDYRLPKKETEKVALASRWVVTGGNY